MVVENPQKPPKKFSCEECNFKCCNKKDYNRHLSTRKHKMITNGMKKPQKNPNELFECVCGNVYKHDSGYYRHKKKCSFIQEENHSNTDKNPSTYTDKELLIKLLLKNPNIIEKLIELL